MITEDRLERLEKAVIELHKLLEWTDRGNTWQSIWDDINAIIKQLKEEHETQD
jgi:hypothetical protein